MVGHTVALSVVHEKIDIDAAKVRQDFWPELQFEFIIKKCLFNLLAISNSLMAI